MGNNKRKRKLKEQDFKKVKFKVGKRLQPAQNATDTSFKSRTIFVPTQMNEVDGPTNQRKQNLKDLLTQVGHYSATTRQEAFVGLRDLFKLHADLLHENLGLIIKPLAEKMTDNDASVRQSLLLLLSFIFPSISQEKMAPFCPLILAHLSCAMTHIYDDIQHDSLGFLEICLQCFPECVVISSSQLTRNFIGMISHQSRPGNAKERHLHQLGRKGLSINPNGKLSSSKSRLKVLQHLLTFLKALESSASLNNKGRSQYLFCSVSNRLKKKPQVFKFLQQEPTKVQILQHSVQESTVWAFTLDGGSPLLCPNNNDSKSNILSDSQQVRELMETVFPLLLECWIECNPAQLTTGLPDSVMVSSTVNMLLVITDVLKVLFKAAQITGTDHLSCFNDNSSANWLADLYLTDFNQQFMVYFPFVANCSVSLKKIKGKLGKSLQRSLEGNDAASVLELNFGICEIMVNFLTMDISARKGCYISVEKLQEFVVHSLELKANGGVKSKLLQAEHVQRLVQFVNQLVLFYCTGNEDSEMVKELLDATFKLYQASHLMSGSKKMLLQFFASLVFSDNHLISRHKDVCMLASEWIPSLPNLLVKLKDTSLEMTQVVLIVLTKAVMQGVLIPNADFLSHLSMYFSKNTGSFVNLRESLQRQTIELLFQLPSLSDQLLHSLVVCCQTSSLQGSVIQYLLQILHYRSPCYRGFLSQPAAVSLATYLSFLFSVAIGCSKEQLNEYQLETNLQVQFHKYTLPGRQCDFVLLEQNQLGEGLNRPDDTQSVLWQGHKTTLQAVCQNYKQCNQSHDLLRHMGVALSTFLVDFKVVPVSAVYSILTVVNCLVELASAGRKDHPPSTSSNLSNELLSKLAELSAVCLSWSTDTNSSSILRHARTEETLTGGSMTVKLDLFDTAIKLLCTVPLMASKVLSVLLHMVKDEDSDDAMKPIFAEVITKLLQSGVKTILFQSTDVVQQIVSLVLGSRSRCSGQSQCFADLQYQHSLFKVEAGQG